MSILLLLVIAVRSSGFSSSLGHQVDRLQQLIDKMENKVSQTELRLESKMNVK